MPGLEDLPVISTSPLVSRRQRYRYQQHEYFDEEAIAYRRRGEFFSFKRWRLDANHDESSHQFLIRQKDVISPADVEAGRISTI